MSQIATSGFADDEVVVFGLGGHKCGSSWIADYFRDHPSCFVPLHKELDVFGVRHARHHNWRIRHRAQKIRDELRHFAELVDKDGAIEAESYEKFQKLNAKIFDIAQNISVLTGEGQFSDIFRRREAEQKWVFDISPYYSLVDSDVYKEMSEVHQNTKFFLSMRDPAERMFSAFRYSKDLKGERFPHRSSWRIGQMKEVFDTPFFHPCTDYGRILSALEQVVPQSDIHTCFYENLFEDSTLEAFCSFLGLEFQHGNYTRKVHETKNDDEVIKMRQEERDFLVEALADIYKDVDDRFGDLAPDSWNWPEDIRQKREMRKS